MADRAEPAAAAERSSPRRRWVLVGVFAVAIVAALLRRPGIVSRPGLFAEDGFVFFHDAHTKSLWDALTTPYAGYLHTTPRLLATLATGLPLSWTPVLYAVSAVVLSTLAMTPALSERLAWLAPSLSVRCVLFLALVMLPGVDDVHSVIANLQWWFGITLVLLALSGDPRSLPGRVGEPLALLLLGLTGPFCILTAPLFWLRLWLRRSRWSLIAASVVTATALVQGIVVLLTHDPSGHPGPVPANQLADSWVLRYGGTAVVGQQVLRGLWLQGLMHGAFWVVAAGFLMLVIGSALRLPRRAAVALGFAAVVGLLSTTIRLRHDVGALEDPLNGGRYYVIPLGMVAITIVVALGRALRDRVVARPRSWPGAAIIVPGLAAGLLLQGTVLDARLPRRPDVRWDASVQCIESHRTCTIPLDPTGFSMTLPPI